MMFRTLSICTMVLALAACGHEGPTTKRKSYDYLKIKEQAEARKRNFNPGFVAKFHAARIFQIRNYEIKDSVVNLQRINVPAMKRVAGDVPASGSLGPFKVTVLSEKRDTLYHYGMPSPLFVRKEHGPEKGLYRVKNGSFHISLPAIEEAAIIILSDSEGTYHESRMRIQ